MAYQLMISAVLWMSRQADRLRVCEWSDLPTVEEDFIERLNLGLLKGFSRRCLPLGVARMWRGAVKTNPCGQCASIMGCGVRQGPWEVCIAGLGLDGGSGPRI